MGFQSLKLLLTSNNRLYFGCQWLLAQVLHTFSYHMQAELGTKLVSNESALRSSNRSYSIAPGVLSALLARAL